MGRLCCCDPKSSMPLVPPFFAVGWIHFHEFLRSHLAWLFCERSTRWFNIYELWWLGLISRLQFQARPANYFSPSMLIKSRSLPLHIHDSELHIKSSVLRKPQLRADEISIVCTRAPTVISRYPFASDQVSWWHILIRKHSRINASWRLLTAVVTPLFLLNSTHIPHNSEVQRQLPEHNSGCIIVAILFLESLQLLNKEWIWEHLNWGIREMASERC